MFFFLILLLLCCKSVPDSKPIENPEDYALIKKWIVTPDSGLNLRESPSRKAKSIRLLPRGTMVSHKQLPENEKPDTIEDQKGKWLKVEIGNESGWVFDVYLSEPVFSPSGDKFYFVTEKHPRKGKITKDSVCSLWYIGIEYPCITEVRDIGNAKAIQIFLGKDILGWYDNNTIVYRWGYNYHNGDDFRFYRIVNIFNLIEINLYSEYLNRNFTYDFFDTQIACIFSKCFVFTSNEFDYALKRNSFNNITGTVTIFSYQHPKLDKVKLLNTEKEIFPDDSIEKKIIRKIQIHKPNTFGIRALTNAEILKLKNPYTGNIEFSVDKRNYLLHVPTGKITEVKEK